MRCVFRGAKLLVRVTRSGIPALMEEAMNMQAVQNGGATMRAVLCASLCNCRHTLRAEGDDRLVEVALEHLRHNHPAAPLVEERVRRIVFSRAYDIEYGTL
jgi:predicted small metal-binding protein